METKDLNQLKLEIEHIFDSGANEIRIEEMVIRFIERRYPTWINVKVNLPEQYKHRMSKDVLTLAGSKMSVKCYDYELMRWSGSPHVTVTHWMKLPGLPNVSAEPETRTTTA